MRWDFLRVPVGDRHFSGLFVYEMPAAGLTEILAALEDAVARPKPAGHLRQFPARFDETSIAAAFERDWGPAFEAGDGRTCRWLYKNITMDATGRIMPCCGAPSRANGDLVLAHVERDAEPFHSRAYRQARLWFVNREAGSQGACSRCQWQDSVADIDYAHVTAYLRAIGPPLLEHGTIRTLAEW